MEKPKSLRSCSIKTCRNFLGTRDESIQFFRPPKNGPTRAEWIRLIEENSPNSGNGYQVCDLHFNQGQMNHKSVNKKLKLAPNAVPEKFELNNVVEKNAETAQSIHGDNQGIEPSHQEKYLEEFKKRLNLEVELIKVREKNEKLLKENNVLMSKNEQLARERNSRNAKIETLIANLSEDDKSLIECLLGSKQKHYSPVVRSFAITMQSYSTRAYEYLREKFHNNLPHVDTIGHWHSNVNFGQRSGITKDALQRIKDKAKEFEDQGKILKTSLSFDEMAIRKHIQWRDSDKRFLGFVDCGKRTEQGYWPIARQALVYLLNGVNCEFSIPIAYFFIDNLAADEKKALLLEVLEAIANTGARVINLTFDGLSTNFSMCKLLGASFDLKDLKPYFINPFDGTKTFIMLDACHMLKLVRNCIGTFDLRDMNNQLISWKFFKSLERFRVDHDFVTHKLTRKHLAWETNKMNVSLATQSLSKSVADSMEYLLRRDIRCFQGVEGTVEFIRTIDSLFDVFNSSKDNATSQFKSPLNRDSFESISLFLSEATTYLKSLKLGHKNIMDSKRKTGFKGFVINISSLLGIWNEHMDDYDLNLRTFALSQDPLESLFGRIRSCLGDNDNPTQEQFTAAYRRLSIPNEIKSSRYANCTDNLKILQISSANRCVDELNENQVQCNREQIDMLTNDSEFLNRQIDSIQRATIEYDAGIIEDKIKSTNFECSFCESVFESNEKVQPNFHRSHNPCESTVNICEHTIKFVEILRTEHNLDYNILLEKILLSLKMDELFPNTDFSHDPSHKDWLVRFIVEDYFRLRAVYIARNLTMDSQKFIRRRFRKAIHFCNE